MRRLGDILSAVGLERPTIMLNHMSMPVLFFLVFILLALLAVGLLMAPRIVAARQERRALRKKP
ncbi:MAG: hypothetical protein ACR2I1_03945 [Propionibacteriaceae bacterium]